MILHSYRVENKIIPLDKHLYHTFIAVFDTHLGRRLVAVIKRIAVAGGYNEEILMSYAYLPVILHDIGKALPLYQLEETGWKKGYFLHEFMGSILLYELFKDSMIHRLYDHYRDKEIPRVNVILSMVIIPVLRHHYALRDLSEQIKDFAKSASRINREYLRFQRDNLIVLLENLRRKINKKNPVLEKLLIEIQEGIKNLPESKMYIDPNAMVLQRILQSTINEVNYACEERHCKPYPSLYLFQLLSLITGVLSTADYLVASIERPPLKNPEKAICCKGYVKKIFRRSEIINIYNTIKNNLGIKCINLEEYTRHNIQHRERLLDSHYS